MSDEEKMKWKIGDDWKELPNVDLGEGLTLKALLESTVQKSESDAQAKLKELETNMSTQLNQIKEALGSKGNALSEAEKKIKEFELSQMSAEEKAQAMANEKIAAATQDLEKAQESANHYKQLFTDDKVRNDLLSAVGSLGDDLQVHSPDQVVRLLRTEGATQLVETDGRFSTVVKMNIDDVPRDMTPKEAIEHFLKLPINANLLKSSLAPGAGSTSPSGAGGSKEKITKAEWTAKVSGAKDDAERRQLIGDLQAGKYEVVENTA